MDGKQAAIHFEDRNIALQWLCPAVWYPADIAGAKVFKTRQERPL